MFLRLPDRPVEIFGIENLQRYEDGNWFSDTKLDGWRTLITIDRNKELFNPSYGVGPNNSLFFMSRRSIPRGGPTKIPVNNEIIQSVVELDLPDKTMFDGEWLSRRTIGEIPESLFVHDMLWLNNEWCGSTSCWDRRKQLENILKDIVKVPESVTSGFTEFFNSRKLMPWTEGIVLKHKNSKIKGNTNDCQDNALWVKFKWRSGDTGREEVT